MQSHPKLDELQWYAEGGGSLEQRETLGRHISLCAVCAARVENLSRRANQLPPADGRQQKGAAFVVPAAPPNQPEAVVPAVESRVTHPPPEAIPHGPKAAAEVVIVDDAPEPLRDHPQYRLRRLLGRGAMGMVYLAENRDLGRLEVIKLLHSHLVDRADLRTRLLREIQAMSSLDHQAIARTFGPFEYQGLFGLTMEFFPGKDLAALVREKGKLSVNDACNIILQTAEGLQSAYLAGMVHRDIKPANLLYGFRSGGPQVKILDFGLAKCAEESHGYQEGLTVDGRLLGTPEYISPEQAINPSQVDIRSDLYSLGCTFYFLLSGQPPFRGPTAMSVVHSQIYDQPLDLRKLNHNVPESLWLLIRWMMAKSPDQRPQSPLHVAAALQEFLATGVIAGLKRDSDATAVRVTPPPALPLRGNPTNATTRRGVRSKKSPMSVNLILSLIPTVALVLLLVFAGERVIGWIQQHIYGVNSGAGVVLLPPLPANVELWLDGQIQERPLDKVTHPLRLPVSAGQHQVVLRRFGEELVDRRFQVDRGQQVALQLDIPAIPPKPTAARPGSALQSASHAAGAAAAGSSIAGERSPASGVSQATAAGTHQSGKNWLEESLPPRAELTLPNATAQGLGESSARQPPLVAPSEESQTEPEKIDANYERGRVLLGEAGAVDSLFFLPNDNLLPDHVLMSGSSQFNRSNTAINLWNIREGTSKRLEWISGPIWDLAISNNGRVVVTYAGPENYSKIQVWVPPIPKAVQEWSDFSGGRAALVLSSDGRVLAGCSADETFLKWNLQARSEQSRMKSERPLGKQAVTAVAIRQRCDAVAVASLQGVVHLWHTGDGKELAKLEGSSATRILHLAFSRNGSLLHATRENGRIDVFDAKEFKLLSTVRAHQSDVKLVSLNLTGRHLVTADSSGVIKTWDTDDMSQLGAFHEPRASAIQSVAIDAKGQVVAVGQDDASIQLWQPK